MAKVKKEPKKYYWMKLKENYFEEDTIAWLEEQENGIYYSNFYLKLCLKSLKTNGVLIRKVGDILIPYDIKKLSEITRVKIDTVIVAMELFKKIGLVQILENGEIYLTQLELMVGSETSKAQLMRSKRAKEKKQHLKEGNNVTSNLPHVTNELPECYTEIEKEIDIEKDKEIEIDKEQDTEKEIEKDKEPDIRINANNTDKGKICSSGVYDDKYKKVIGRRNRSINCTNKELAIDIEDDSANSGEPLNNTDESFNNFDKSLNNAYEALNNTAYTTCENNIMRRIYTRKKIYKHLEKCGFIMTDKLKEFIEEDITQYGEKLIIEGADECVRKGKVNNYGYLMGILKNWAAEEKGERGIVKEIANASAYTPMKSIFDE